MKHTNDPSSPADGAPLPEIPAGQRIALEAELRQLLEESTTRPDIMRQASAILYLRVSTKKQAKKGGEREGFSIPAQRDACKRKAQALNAVVVAEFVEKGETAKTADRPELQKLLAYIAENPVTYVITHKLDRWARNREDDVDLDKVLRSAGAQLISVSENYDDTPSGALFRGVMSSINEFYSRNLALEVVKGSVEKAKLGGTPGKAPIGYLNVRKVEQGREYRTVEIDQERAPLIIWAFNAYTSGEWTLRTLLKELTKRGLRSVPGPERPSKPLSISQLNRVLRSPYYKGLITYRGVTYLGNHDPLVDIDTWNRVQEVLDAQNHAGEKRRQHHHYLKGSIFCGQCGSRLIVSNAKNRHGTIYPYFICIGRQKKRTDCTQQAMPTDWVETKVEEHYEIIKLSSERAESLREYVQIGLSSRRANAELEQKQQTTRIQQLTDERKKLLQAHYEGAVPLDLLKEEQARIAREMEAAQSRLEATEKAFVDIQDTLEQALQLAQDCQQAYILAGPKLRRLFNQAFFDKIYLDDEGNVRSVLAEPFSGLLGDALAAEAEAVLAERAKEAKTQTPGRDLLVTPGGETTDLLSEALAKEEAATNGDGFTYQTAHIQDSSFVTGLNESRLVGAEGLEPPTPAL